jgi:heme/copper-type cytochrome/quinol oxidase subunit 2
MEQSLTRPRVFVRRPIDALARVHLAGLIGMALAFVYLQALLIGTFLPVPTVLAAITVVIAGITASGWRWAPLLGTVWLILVDAISAGVIGYHLARPENTHDFAFYVVVLGVSVAAVVSGIAALLQPGRGQAEHTPRWLPMFLLAVAMLCLGAIAVELIPRPSAASVSRAILDDLPAVTTANFAFDRAEIRAKAGETVALRLENADAATHAFAIDAFGLDVPMHSGETSLALFRPTAPGTYTFYCSVPHHEDMQGTLIVGP